MVKQSASPNGSAHVAHVSKHAINELQGPPAAAAAAGGDGGDSIGWGRCICVPGTREGNVLSAGGVSAGSTGATSGPLPTVSQTCIRLLSRPCRTGVLSLPGQQASMYDLYLLLKRCLLRMSNPRDCQWQRWVSCWALGKRYKIRWLYL
jgi:hypothetical protein